MSSSKKNGARKKRLIKPESHKQWVVRQCGYMRRHAEVRGLATPEEIADIWPKSARAPMVKWTRVYGFCRVWMARQDTDPSRIDQAEERMLDALNEEPRSVRMPISGRSVLVYPKSMRTLLWFRAHDWVSGWIAARASAIREAADEDQLEQSDLAEPIAVLSRCERELGTQLSSMAAVACYEGPGMPPEAEDTAPSSDWLGEDWTEIDAIDLYAVHAAFIEVNAGRMEALERIVKPQRAGENERMSWNVFLGTLAMKLHKDPTELASDYSLVKLLSQVRLGRPDMDELEA